MPFQPSSDTRPEPGALSAAERQTLHQLELGLERLHRAHGHLVAFHHNVGRAMDHLADAEGRFRQCGHDSLANRLRDEYLPRGVVAADGAADIAAGRWSYDILENFQRTFLRDILAFGDEVHEQVSGGLWHAFERTQERDRKQRVARD